MGAWLVGGVGVLVAVAVHVYAQAGMVFALPDWSRHTFRAYFAADQLSYFALVATVAHGGGAAHEPFTETGSIYYPRLYYIGLGVLSWALGVSPLVTWLVTGLGLQCVVVGAVGIVTAVLTRLPWLTVLGAVPFLLGTFSVLAQGDWLTTLDSHAVLFGGYGVMFPLNGESASLCLAGLAILTLLLVVTGRVRGGSGLVASLLASCLLGALANVHTYSFLTASSDPSTNTVFTYEDGRTRALSVLLHESGRGVVLTDPCVDPYRAKVVGGGAVAMFNEGMAWPAHKDEIKELLTLRLQWRDLDLALARRAGVSMVVTDRSCPVSWETDNGAGLTRIRSEPFPDAGGGGTIDLWLITPA